MYGTCTAGQYLRKRSAWEAEVENRTCIIAFSIASTALASNCPGLKFLVLPSKKRQCFDQEEISNPKTRRLPNQLVETWLSDRLLFSKCIGLLQARSVLHAVIS